jgi:hypothetical protein
MTLPPPLFGRELLCYFAARGVSLQPLTRMLDCEKSSKAKRYVEVTIIEQKVERIYRFC